MLSEVEPFSDDKLICFCYIILVVIIVLFAIAIDIVVTFDFVLTVVPFVELSIVADLNDAIDEHDAVIHIEGHILVPSSEAFLCSFQI